MLEYPLDFRPNGLKMKKGERTREWILAQSAAVFNQHGYAATSMSDLMLATKLEKGGIYNHFASKEQLSLEAFDYAVGLIETRFEALLEGRKHSLERLKAVMDVFLEFIHDPVLPGGCPVLNAAIEADDSNEKLRERIRLVLNGWRTRIQGIVEKGVAVGELRTGTDGAQLATVILATLEGAVMISKVYRDAIHMRIAAGFLEAHLKTLQVKEVV
jgi:TetR/AcrR family transcriptional regulator, transcriptional repressor for nem operon